MSRKNKNRVYNLFVKYLPSIVGGFLLIYFKDLPKYKMIIMGNEFYSNGIEITAILAIIWPIGNVYLERWRDKE